MRDAYTAAWTDRADPPELARLAGLAYDFGHLGRAAAWERAFAGLRPGEMGGFEGGTAEWLIDAADFGSSDRAGATR